jgi:hypothetical protein
VPDAPKERRWPLPAYFDASPFEGAEALPGAAKSRRLQLYEQFAAARFTALPEGAGRDDLRALDEHMAMRLDAEVEERRLHFGAFALVAVLFMMVFLHQASTGFADLALDALALLLLVLLVPYVFVYFGFENRVRAMFAGRLRIAEALARIEEKER